jgi:hypothetical protein
MASNVMSAIEAVRNGKVYVISDSNIIERPGPRIVRGLEEMFPLISPEAAASGDEAMQENMPERGVEESPGPAGTNATPGPGALTSIIAITLTFILIRTRQR